MAHYDSCREAEEEEYAQEEARRILKFHDNLVSWLNTLRGKPEEKEILLWLLKMSRKPDFFIKLTNPWTKE